MSPSRHRSKLKWQEDKKLERTRRRTALAGIKKIRPRIHRITFSWPGSQSELKQRMGLLKKYNSRGQMARHYPKKAYSWQGKTKLTYFFAKYREGKYLKPSVIELTYKRQKDLVDLCEKLPELKVRSVEYAIDFFCKDPQSVSGLFTLLARCMYFSHAKKAEFKGGEFEGWREERDENAVLKVGRAKIYERGPDSKGKSKGDRRNPDLKSWDMEDVDRVRLEFKVDRKHPGRKKLTTIKEFMQDLEVEKRIYDKIKFRVFTESKDLPTNGAEYFIQNNGGKFLVFECFQQAYLYWKKRKTNISQYVKEDEALIPFRNEIGLKIRQFEE